MKLGDVVYLNSGGRPMTIVGVNPVGDDKVQYFYVGLGRGRKYLPGSGVNGVRPASGDQGRSSYRGGGRSALLRLNQ